MKKFSAELLEWKKSAGLVFSGAVVLFCVVMLFLGNRSVPIFMLASILIMSVTGTFLQLLAFTDVIIKKARYTLRIAVFAVPFFAAVSANAYIFRWFPAGGGYWPTFIAVFLVVFAVFTVGFEIYFYVIGKKYDGLLGQYRRQKELEQEKRAADANGE